MSVTNKKPQKGWVIKKRGNESLVADDSDLQEVGASCLHVLLALKKFI